MDYFHSDILSHSIQQSCVGRLPKGVLDEISEARELASDIFKSISIDRILEIDREVYRNGSYWAEDVVCDFTRRGLYSKWLPKMIGGGGGHPLAFYGLNLEMGSHCLGISNLIGAHYVALGLVSATHSFGVLKKITNEILQAENSGGHCTVALAITEPEAGSDMEDVELMGRARVGTRAEKVSGGYQITGQKIFISNSLFAKWYIGSAFLDLKNPLDSLIIFAVKANASGVNLGRVEEKLGQSASPANVLFFDNVFVPNEDICFSREQFTSSVDYKKNAEFLLNDLLSLSRAGVGVLATGSQKRILEMAISASEKKYIYGKKATDFEWVQSQIAKITQNLIISKTLSWEGHIECYSRGPYKDLQRPVAYSLFKYTPKFVMQFLLGPLLVHPKTRASLRKKRRESIKLSDEKLIFGWGSLVKSVCSDKAMESIGLALELIGNDGGDEYWELEKFLRDIKLLQIYEGTNELNELMCFKNFIGPKEADFLVFKE
ncbi:MAG: acyl-CoA dehydrogenase family protein [Bacteriovorax sp.]